MSYYVRRIQHGDGPNKLDGAIGWTGPIRSRAQAEREKAAWEMHPGSYGQTWTAEVIESSREIRAEVRRWSRETRRPRIRIAS
jgi:hypothetical protein